MDEEKVSTLFKKISSLTNGIGKTSISGGYINKNTFPNLKFGKKGFTHVDYHYSDGNSNLKINLRIPNKLFGKSLEAANYDIEVDSIFISNFGTVVANVDNIKKIGLSLKEITESELEEYCINKGYFDLPKKDPPLAIKNIVCITSSGGNIDSEILKTTNLPEENIKFYHCNNSEEIASKITKNQDTDIIVLFRGGFDDANMLMFSEIPVIEAVVNSKIPVFAALGHADDNPFIYKIADKTFPTPSSFAKSIEYHKIDSNLKQVGNIIFLSVPVIIYISYLFYGDIMKSVGLN